MTRECDLDLFKWKVICDFHARSVAEQSQRKQSVVQIAFSISSAVLIGLLAGSIYSCYAEKGIPEDQLVLFVVCIGALCLLPILIAVLVGVIWDAVYGFFRRSVPEQKHFIEFIEYGLLKDYDPKLEFD